MNREQQVNQLIKTTFNSRIPSLLLWSFTCLVLWIIGISLPLVIGRLMDGISKKSFDMSSFYLSIMLLIAFIDIIGSALSRYLQAKISVHSTSSIIESIISHISTLPLSEIMKLNATETTQQIFTDSSVVIEFVLNNAINLLQRALTLIVSAIIIISIDFKIGILCVVGVLFYSLVYLKFKTPIQMSIKKYREQHSCLFEQMSGNLKIMEFSKRHAVTEYFIQNTIKEMSTFNSIFLKNQKINILFDQSCYAISKLLQLSMYGYAIAFMSSTALSIGELTSIMSYVMMWLGTVSYAFNFLKDYQSFKISRNRISNIICIDSTSCGPLKINDIEEIHLSNCILRLASDKLVLNNFSNCFQKNKIYKIKGKNGIGKSSMIDLILGLRSLETGTLSINGIDYHDVNFNLLRSENLSISDQIPVVFQGTLANNIIMSRNITLEKANEILDIFFKSELEKQHIESRLLCGGKGLSGGERQKISLARALSKDSDVIILDEPLNALDTQSTEHLASYLEKIRKNKIILIVTHDNHINHIFDEEVYIG